MGDLIDRQTAIEMIVIEANKPGACGYIDAKSVVDMLNKLPTEQRWIPCNERMPEEKDARTPKRSDRVIATCEANGERMTVTARTYNGVWEWNMKFAFPDRKIVAWMPLPEPYREREAAND